MYVFVFSRLNVGLSICACLNYSSGPISPQLGYCEGRQNGRKATYSGLSIVASPNRWNGPCPRLAPLQASIPRADVRGHVGEVACHHPSAVRGLRTVGRASGCCLGTDLAGPRRGAVVAVAL